MPVNDGAFRILRNKDFLLTDNRLTLLAWQAFKVKQAYSYYAVILTARVKEYFIAVYDKDFKYTVEPAHVSEEKVISLFETLNGVYVVTDNSLDFICNLSNDAVETDINLNARLWIFYAFEQFKCKNFASLWLSEPFYLKEVYTISK